MARSTFFLWSTLQCAVALVATAAAFTTGAATEKATRPVVAVFPLAGDASADLRDKVGFAVRAKIARDGHYQPIDGVVIAELTDPAQPPALSARPADLLKLVEGERAAVLIWGELRGGTPTSLAGSTLRLNVLDLRPQVARPPHAPQSEVSPPEARRLEARPILIEGKMTDPTDLRSVVESVVRALPGAAAAGQPIEPAVVDDDVSRKLWLSNPNLIAGGDFAGAAAWNAVHESGTSRVTPATTLPAADKVGIHAAAAAGVPGDGVPGDSVGGNAVLAMRLSRPVAEDAGLSCLSDAVAIKPGRRYRLSFRYWSEGPTALVFVKGYATAKDAQGKTTEGNKPDRECYRAQVHAGGATDGRWRTVVADVNPYHPAFAVERLRVDLYAHLAPGVILFDDVVLKDVGDLTRKPKDDAIVKPVTRPAVSE